MHSSHSAFIHTWMCVQIQLVKKSSDVPPLYCVHQGSVHMYSNGIFIGLIKRWSGAVMYTLYESKWTHTAHHCSEIENIIYFEYSQLSFSNLRNYCLLMSWRSKPCDTYVRSLSSLRFIAVLATGTCIILIAASAQVKEHTILKFTRWAVPEKTMYMRSENCCS